MCSTCSGNSKQPKPIGENTFPLGSLAQPMICFCWLTTCCFNAKSGNSNCNSLLLLNQKIEENKGNKVFWYLMYGFNMNMWINSKI